MADFQGDLVTVIVATVISILVFFALVLVLALYWTSIARRIAPNRFAEPVSEKAWPSSRESSLLSASPDPSLPPSPRASQVPNPPALPKAVLKDPRGFISPRRPEGDQVRKETTGYEGNHSSHDLVAGRPVRSLEADT
ncbi:hypothetical protein F4802DRAFT_593792 [Xylaria palmicola]|nr:hypothetical protein F4802DRAFT_593792 [Xylaria palmicola]